MLPLLLWRIWGWLPSAISVGRRVWVSSMWKVLSSHSLQDWRWVRRWVPLLRGGCLGTWLPPMVRPWSDGRTWLLNELLHPFWAKYEVTFVSNGKSFHAFYGYGPASWVLYYVDTIGNMKVYSSGTWTNEAYRTVEFDEAPTGDLLTWLEANGTRV